MSTRTRAQRDRQIEQAIQHLREGWDVADLLEIGRRICPRDDLEERVSALEARVEHLYVMRDEELMVEHDRETARTKAELAHMEATGELRLDAVPGDPEYDPAPAPPEATHNREGGDANAAEPGPVPAPDDGPDVAPGAGAERELDAPAPSEGEEGEVEPDLPLHREGSDA
jgi:hypothetical protein